MPIARKLQVDDDSTTAYHCISRCVRKAHLCGEQDESRREWVRELITEASGAFAAAAAAVFAAAPVLAAGRRVAGAGAAAAAP